MKGGVCNGDNLSAKGRAFGDSIGNGGVSKLLAREMSRTKVFGRLGGSHPKAAFRKTAGATYRTPRPSLFSDRILRG